MHTFFVSRIEVLESSSNPNRSREQVLKKPRIAFQPSQAIDWIFCLLEGAESRVRARTAIVIENVFAVNHQDR